MGHEAVWTVHYLTLHYTQHPTRIPHSYLRPRGRRLRPTLPPIAGHTDETTLISNIAARAVQTLAVTKAKRPEVWKRPAKSVPAWNHGMTKMVKFSISRNGFAPRVLPRHGQMQNLPRLPCVHEFFSMQRLLPCSGPGVGHSSPGQCSAVLGPEVSANSCRP